jgi:FixJ family two-component response regulator
MRSTAPTVFLVDDDSALLRALDRLLTAEGYQVVGFSSAEAFLQNYSPRETACLVLDLHLPGMSGLELQEQLVQQHAFVPVIVMTGHGTISAAVQATKAGAVSFLMKPFTPQQLTAEIRSALALFQNKAAERARIEEIREHFQSLTRREREIFECVVKGRLNKQTASDLHIVVNTVKVHRRRVMRKMRAGSLADLVIMAQQLKPAPATTLP